VSRVHVQNNPEYELSSKIHKEEKREDKRKIEKKIRKTGRKKEKMNVAGTGSVKNMKKDLK